MVMSWDLGYPMKERRAKFGATHNGLRTHVGRWEIMTGWADDVINEEADEVDERLRSDGDVLGEVSTTIGRRHRLTKLSSIPFEDGWETDLDAFRPEIVRSFA